MTNLLPLPEQKKVWSRQRARFALVLALVLLVLSAVALLALIPSYFALELAAPPLPEATTATSTPTDASGIARAQTLLRILAPMSIATSSPTAAIAAALADKPSGISVTHVTYAAGAAAQAGQRASLGEIQLVGTGARDAVSAYQATLSGDTRFTSVSVPVAALVGSIDNHFTLSLSGAF